MPDNARSSAPHRWARALFALAGIAALIGIVGFVATTGGGEATGTEPVSTFGGADGVPSAPPPSAPPSAAPPPTTVSTGGGAQPDDNAPDEPAVTATTSPSGSPAVGSGATAPNDSTAPAPSITPTPTTPPLSPLAEQLGERGSAIPERIEPRIVPTRIAIDDLYIDVPVRPVGLEDDGQLEIPDETEVGWYRYGAVPGRSGATVLAGHVTWNRTNGPFWLLRDLEPGALIDVELEDGSVRTYEAVERAVYGKDELPRNRIWRNTGDETLVLITCGGDYNPDIRRYLENVVVYAAPVESGRSTDDDLDGG